MYNNAPLDEIRIERLEIYAYHGVYPEETKEGQTFEVNVTLFTDTRAAGQKDDLNLSTNYGEVCLFINDWMQNNTCKLIEAVAEKLAEAILLEYPRVQCLDLEIRKPEAPVEMDFRCISVKVRRGWHKVYLSIGSNMGDKEDYLNGAVRALADCRKIRVGKRSNWMVTKPYGGVEQDDFLNGAIEIDTLYSPEELLEELHRIEKEAGRERLVHWGPRTLDLDILFYDDLIYESTTLKIPHIDMQNREFVLKPLSEIAANYRHPVYQKTVSQMLSEI